MSVQDTLEILPETRARPDAPAADTRPEPGLLETAIAGGRVAWDEIGQVQDNRLNDGYTPVIKALRERTGKGVSAYRRGFLQQFADMTSDRVWDADAIWRDIEAERRRDPEAFKEIGTREEFEQQLLRRGEERDADLDTLARGNAVAGFVGAVGAQVRDPFNMALTIGTGGVSAGARSILQVGLREAAINAAGEALYTPAHIANKANLGEEVTAGDVATNIAVGAAFGFAVPTTVRGLQAIDAAAYQRAAPIRAKFDQFFADRDLARAFSEAVPDHLRTPDQAAALKILTREVEIADASPFARTIGGDEAHRANLERATAALLEPDEALGGFNMSRYLSRNRAAESSGDDAARAATSSAFGRYQFLKDTWLDFYRRTFGSTGESEAQILAKRANGAVQDRVMRTFTQANVDALQRAGLPVDDGTVYLAHFLGIRGAVRVLRSAPDTPIARVVDADSIAANGAVFRNVSSTSELVAWARGKMGGKGRGVPANEDAGGWAGIDPGDDVPVIRPAALDADRPFVSSAGRQVPIAQFRPADIGVDAELMQFKSGGDEFGVTERLQGVRDWDPVAAGLVTVWEGSDGRRLIADGHQRLGLARRVEAGGAEVSLNAFVLREADGFSARDARIITALKNVGEGTGTAADAAKVLREAGPMFEDMIERRLPPRSALVRDGKALARLSDEAFGAVVNEVVPEGHAAAIGHLAPDPSTHMALVELLAKTDPPNRRQAEAIIRQALDAGFSRETQEELFGARDMVSSLFLQKARLLDRTLSELKRLKGAFGVAARNAEALESGGNRIDIAGSEAAAAGNARALALVELLALRKGNAVNELIDQATQRLAGGEPLARVVRDVVAGIRELDLADLERAGRGADGAGDGPVGSGRAGLDPREAGASEELGPESLTPAELDELAETVDLGPGLFDDPAAPAARAFDSDDGPGVKAAAESDWHDIRAQADDPNITARQRQEAELGAAAPMRAGVDQDGEMGLALFDEADQPTFDLDDGKGPRSAAEIEAEIAADKAGLEEIRKCLK